MAEKAYAFPVHRLEADGYSVPRGSHGIVEDADRSLWSVRWFPPATGTSSGVNPDDLVEAGEFLIPKAWF